MAAAEKTEVALIAAPRLPYHPALEERFGIDRASWRALIDAVFPAAKSTDSVVLALSYCKARKLDPFKRPVHIVPVWDSEKRDYVETVWPGIAEHRTTAFRTKQYAGAEAAVFGPTVEKTFTGETKKGRINATVKFAEWAQLTVFRMIDGQRVPMPGPRVYWLETYSRLGRTEVPNDRWQKAPMQMLEKCAEAAALRRAFPEEIGDEPVAEEAGSYSRGGGDAKDVTPPRPTRAGFVWREVDPAAAGHEDLDQKYRATVDEDGVIQDEKSEGPASAKVPASVSVTQSGDGAPDERATAADGSPAKAGDQAGTVPSADPPATDWPALAQQLREGADDQKTVPELDEYFAAQRASIAALEKGDPKLGAEVMAYLNARRKKLLGEKNGGGK